MHSNLCDGVYIADSSNYTQGRNGNKICKFTPHMMGGILTGKQCAVNIFQNPARNASANYCIGNDGDLVCNVEEENRAWTSSSRSNDYQAITVEVSNCENGGQWKVSDAAWNKLVELAVDVCRRYNFRLYYDGTPNGSLTTHNMFANTDCPGPYMLSKMNELANTVNAILDGQPVPPPTPTPEPTPEPQTSGRIAEVQQWCCNYGYEIAVDNYYGPQTKKALIKILQNEMNKQYGAHLDVDGIFGSKSKSAWRNVKQGARGNITKAIQGFLICFGYNTNGFDSIFGNGTAKAVKEYQLNKGLTPDAIVGKLTISNMTE